MAVSCGLRRLALGALLIALLGGCSVRRMAANAVGNALAGGTSGWAADDDPELIRDATPFALKTIESLLAETPGHRGLLLAATAGFTQYAYAFVQADADFLEEDDLAAATALRGRAKKLYRRALGYGLRGLEVEHEGFTAALRRDAAGALARMERRHVPLLYWTAASWGALVSLAKDDGEVSADLPLAAAMMARAQALDEGFGDGAIHDFFIAYEAGRPPSAGGSVERARAHLGRALALAGGRRAAPLVAFAESASIASQDRAEFERLLAQALAIDVDRAPEQRLANLIAQRRARWLLGRSDELFLE